MSLIMQSHTQTQKHIATQDKKWQCLAETSLGSVSGIKTDCFMLFYFFCSIVAHVVLPLYTMCMQCYTSWMQLDISTLELIKRVHILYLMLCHATLFDLLGNLFSCLNGRALARCNVRGECQPCWLFWCIGLWSHQTAGIITLLLNQVGWGG